MIYIAIAVLVAFANSAVAGSKTPAPTKSTNTRTSVRPQATSEVSGSECYRKGTRTRCPVSTSTTATTARTIGIIFGIIGFLLIVYVCVIFKEEIKAFFSKMRRTKGANQQAPPGEGTIPLYHDKRTSADADQKPGSVAESEEPPQTSAQRMAPPATGTPSQQAGL